MFRRNLCGLLVAVAGLGAALAVTSTGAPAASTDQPVFSAANGVVVFDFVPVGSSVTRQDLITNRGTAPLTFGRIAVTGLHPRDFVLSTDGCSGRTLAPQATCNLAITFAPTVAGTRSAAVQFPDNTACDSWITLAGSGTDTSTPTTARAATCDSISEVPGPTTTVTSTTTTTVTTRTAPVSGADVIQIASRCSSRRTVTVSLTAPKRTTFSKVTIQIHGRRFKTYRGREITARISLAGLPRGRFTLRVHATTADGRRFTQTRRVTTCVKNYS